MEAKQGEEQGDWEYEYDLLNRLRRVTKNGKIVSSYLYDPEGFRVVKKTSEQTIHYVFEGTEPIFEKNVTTGQIKNYVYALGKHLARVDGVIGDPEAKVYFYHTDHLGSIKTVSNKTGKVVWNADYLAFGTRFGMAEGSDFEEWHGFTGKEYDPDTGLSYFNARWYDEELGRFISEDPAMDPNNPNLYVYCANNPLVYIDPTGLLKLGDIGLANPGGVNYDPDIEIGGKSGGGGDKGGGGNSGGSSGGTSSSPQVPGITRYSFENSSADYSTQWSIDMYFNRNGDLITVSTLQVGNTVEQHYRITPADGSVVREEIIEYVSGISNQRNVIAVEGFVSGATYSRAIMIIVGREGNVGAWQGSTLPSDPKKYATIAETATGKPLEMSKGMHYGEKATYEAIIFDENKPLSTSTPNPNEKSDYYGLYFADRIHLHSAVADTKLGSAGCQTIRPFDDGSKYRTTRGVGWNTFYDAVGGTTVKQGDFLGYYYLTRL